MGEDDTEASVARVRVLGEVVGLALDERDVAGLARALDAALAMIEEMNEVADASGMPVAGDYDPAWPDGGRT